MKFFRAKKYSFFKRFFYYFGINLIISLLLLANNSFAENYKVKRGDTLYGIAKNHNTTVKELKQLNKLKRSALKIGQRLVIPTKEVDATRFPDEQSEIPTYLGQEIEINTESEVTGHEVPNSEKDFEVNDVDLEYLDKKERLILFAKKFLDIPYRFGGSSILGIDCSAFVQKVFDFLNIPLPRTAREQFYIGDKVYREDLTIGDLVFFKTYASFPSHVGIYIGNNFFIHASSKDKKVKINNLDEPYYFKRFLGAKRLLEPHEFEAKPKTEENKPP